MRRLRFTGPEIAEALAMPLSTVSGILTRIGMGRLGRLGLEPAERYERQRPGRADPHRRQEARQDRPPRARSPRRSAPRSAGYHRRAYDHGWEFVHVAIDDCTRLAYIEVLADEKATTAIGVPAPRHRVLPPPRHHRRALITDNGAAYRSTVHAIACRALGIRHLRTRPYRPQTNGKAERLIRTMLGGWAYGAFYRNSTERAAALDGWLHYYNHHRPHSALGRKPPIARLNERTNPLGSYT